MKISPISYYLSMIDAFQGDHTQEYGNAVNSTSSCLPIDLTSHCQNLCTFPAVCSSKTGRCECVQSSLILTMDRISLIKQTCFCPNDPIFTFQNDKCVQVSNGKLSMILLFLSRQLLFHLIMYIFLFPFFF
jgi:hypothetical protein